MISVTVNEDDCTQHVHECKTLGEAEALILDLFNAGLDTENIDGIIDTETGKEYGAEWSVKLSEI